jgi:hypothetical protein
VAAGEEAEELVALVGVQAGVALAVRTPVTVGRCHRRMLADAVLAAGGEVRHPMEGGRLDPHRLHPVARVERRLPVYDVEATGQARLDLEEGSPQRPSDSRATEASPPHLQEPLRLGERIEGLQQPTDQVYQRLEVNRWRSEPGSLREAERVVEAVPAGGP